MTAIGLLTFRDLLPAWVLAAWLGIVVLGPLLLLLVGTVKRLGKVRKTAGFAPMPPAMLPAELTRCGQPWIGRLGFMGHQVTQILRPAGDDAPDTATWVMPSTKDRSVALLTGTLSRDAERPGFSLRLMTFLADGRVIVTADHPVTHRAPSHWALVQQSFPTLEAQVQAHRAEVQAMAGGAAAIVPGPSEIIGRITAEELAVNEALVSYGAYRTSGENEIRPAFSHAPAMVIRDFFAKVAGFRSTYASKKDVATVRKQALSADEELTSVGGFKVSIEDLVAQDVRRYRKHADQPADLGFIRRRSAALLITLVAFTAAFGRENPVLTVGMMLGLITVHEFGHWVMMKIFRYQRIGSFFIPFLGPSIDQGRKLHASAWQQLAVILAGPLPGMIFGLGVTISGFFLTDLPMWLRDLGGLALALNAFQLLPFLPLDGGRAVDLLIFRDLPFLRPFFTIISGLATMVAGLLLKSKALKILAFGMFTGLAWDFNMIKVVRGGRRLGWAGKVDDENEALEKIFRGVREENNESFMRSGDWQRQMDVLIGEVLRKRPGFLLRFFGGAFYWWSLGIPALLIGFLFAGKFVGSAGQLNQLAKDVIEFREGFPEEKRSVTQEQYDAVSGLADLTFDAVADGIGTPAELATLLPTNVTSGLDRLDWAGASIMLHGGEIESETLSIWLESLCARMEAAVKNGQHAEALRRVEVLLHGLNALEPAGLLAEREAMWNAELRTLGAVEQLAASGKLDTESVKRLDARISALNKAPVPAVECRLLVDAWGDQQAQTAFVAPVQADGEKQGFDARFWRLATPQSWRFFDNIKDFDKSTPATVMIARHWKKTARVGELPPKLDDGVKVHPAPGEAEFIMAFCEGHRRITWRRIVTLSALRLEAFRQQKGSFPQRWTHSVPGGAQLTLENSATPCLKLEDMSRSITKTPPDWMGPMKSTAPLDYVCPLNPSQEISKK